MSSSSRRARPTWLRRRAFAPDARCAPDVWSWLSNRTWNGEYGAGSSFGMAGPTTADEAGGDPAMLRQISLSKQTEVPSWSWSDRLDNTQPTAISRRPPGVDGCRILASALASIWRMRSRVTLKWRPTSSRVAGSRSPNP